MKDSIKTVRELLFVVMLHCVGTVSGQENQDIRETSTVVSGTSIHHVLVLYAPPQGYSGHLVAKVKARLNLVQAEKRKEYLHTRFQSSTDELKAAEVM